MLSEKPSQGQFFKIRLSKKQLPIVIFYDNHLGDGTYNTLINLLPSLERIGYNLLLVEPEFGFEDIDSWLYFYENVHPELPSILNGIKLIRQLFVTAKDHNMDLVATDLSLKEFHAEIIKISDHFFRIAKLDSKIRNTLIELLRNQFGIDWIYDVFNNISKKLLEFKVPIEIITNYLDFINAYFSNRLNNNNNSAEFFERRTEHMAKMTADSFHENKNIVVMIGYCHPIHPLLKKLTSYLIPIYIDGELHSPYLSSGSQKIDKLFTQASKNNNSKNEAKVNDLPSNKDIHHFDENDIPEIGILNTIRDTLSKKEPINENAISIIDSEIHRLLCDKYHISESKFCIVS